MGRGWPGKESSPALPALLPEGIGLPPHQLSQMWISSGSSGKSVKDKKLCK